MVWVVLLSETSVPTYFDKMVFGLLYFTPWRELSPFCLHTLVHEEIFISVLQSQFHLLKIHFNVFLANVTLNLGITHVVQCMNLLISRCRVILK